MVVSRYRHGRIQLDLTFNGVKISGMFWALETLSTNMIIGSQLLDEIGATVNYNSRSITSAVFPQMGRLQFDLKGAPRWRQDVSVTIRSSLVLQPHQTRLIIAHVECQELRTLTAEEMTFGGVHGIKEMEEKGIYVHESQNRLQSVFEGGRMIAQLNIVMENLTGSPVKIKGGTQVGAYRPQHEQSELRVDIASVEGVKLAIALGLEGTDAVKGLFGSRVDGDIVGSGAV